MPAPVVTFINSTEVEVKWDPSSFHHGGPIIDSYELIINSTKTEEINRQFIIEASFIWSANFEGALSKT